MNDEQNPPGATEERKPPRTPARVRRPVFLFPGRGGGLWGGALGAFTWILSDAKATISALEDFRPKVGSRVYSADGELLGEFAGDEHRQLVSLNEIPLHVQKAFLATEDHTFYEHKGVRPDAIVNAMIYTLDRPAGLRGGSTISQQVVRNIEPLAVGQERNLRRKIREAIVAFQVEKDFTKDEILELYLNQSFLGVSAHGVQAAARQYFAKDVWDLTIAEGAMLAGLMRAPNPFSRSASPKGVIQHGWRHGDIVLEPDARKGSSPSRNTRAPTPSPFDDSVVTPEERAGARRAGQAGVGAQQVPGPVFRRGNPPVHPGTARTPGNL